MKQLSKECIEELQSKFDKSVTNLYDINIGATEALTNPSIYEKANLVTLDEMFAYVKWVDENNYTFIYHLEKWYDGVTYITEAELFTIYKNQK